MITWMLADVICHEFNRSAGKDQLICHEFNRSAGKDQNKTGKALHIGFGMRCGNDTDQYNVTHMYIFSPYNYVYVAIQQERLDEDGDRHVGPMYILSYHDSCWRDAIQTWIFKNRDNINVFRSFKLDEWFDVVELTEAEREYLEDAEQWRRDNFYSKETCPIPNPFDKRGIWAGKA